MNESDPLPNRRQGTALVLVLCVIVFASILVVAFFGSVSHELVSSKNYSSGVSSRIYADAAVNLVIGQLQAGTTQDDPTKMWVSQPGLIRLFDNNGNQEKAFKLYSSDRMVEGATFSPTTGGTSPSDVPAWTSSTDTASLPWNSSPNVYADLNSPIVVNSVPNYPILNPGGLAAATKIQGFDVLPAYALPDSSDMNKNGDTAEVGQIPMPVKWVYILTDGQIAVSDAASSNATDVTLTTTDGEAVKGSNPPVARVAFWTDDSTCRLNINTASEGSYWTLPVAVATDESLASGQVNAREFQRYPGHPSTTCLSPALDFLTTDTNDLRNFIFALTPRISGRGSQFGARRIGYGLPVKLDNDRLYPDVDDLLFLPQVNPSGEERYRTTTANIQTVKQDELDFKFTSHVQTSMAGSPYTFTTSFSLDPARLELLRFFLTAGSNAPEVNLFGKPRISLWPVDTRGAYQSLQDKLLAFSSTMNGAKYYFQRQNPNSRTEDYLSITRNQELLTYLDHLTSTAIPGLGGTFSSKCGAADRTQMLTSIFDWIRTVNIAYRDPAGVVQPYAWQVNPDADGKGTAKPPGLPGSGQVLPIEIGATSGFGRFPTLSKAAFAIVREKETPDQPSAGKTTVNYRVVFLMETYVPLLGYAGFVPNYQIAVSNLGSGFEAVADLVATAGSTTPVAGSAQAFPLNFQDGTIQVNVPANVEPFYGRAWGGTQGYNNLFLYSDTSQSCLLKPRTLSATNTLTGYPFVSNPFTVIADTSKKDLIRVGLRPVPPVAERMVHVQLKDATGSQPLGSFDLPFAPFGPVAGAFLGKITAASGDSSLHPNLQERVNQMAQAYQVISGASEVAWAAEKNIFGSIDVVRGVELGHGDLRVLALHGSGGSNVFVRHKDYTATSRSHAHSLLSPGGSTWAYNNEGMMQPNQVKPPEDRRGYLVTGTTWGSSGGFLSGSPLNFLPQAPSAMSNVPAPGDFTTGVGSEGDGPHILKADEGNSSSIGLNWGMSVQVPYQNQLFPWDSRLSEAFSPNRQVTSAVQLGTIPALAASDVPWRTLLFRPDILAVAHPGAAAPADSSLLDLFWMPIVDPYPMSTPLSTAGKVNMNSQIAPFTYITRSTALLGALKSVKVMAIPKEQSEYYKLSGYVEDASKGKWPISYLYDVDSAKTMLFFEERFSNANPNSNIFLSPSEICSIPLVPKQNTKSVVGTGHPDDTPAHPIATASIGTATDAGSVRSAVKDFWTKNTLTGDNVLEAPYNSLYPRLTTQSNTYTVYVRAQALQVPASTTDGKFSNVAGRVTGEYRGSYEIERYLDQNDVRIPDFATNFAKTIYPYYKFRVLTAKQFIP